MPAEEFIDSKTPVRKKKSRSRPKLYYCSRRQLLRSRMSRVKKLSAEDVNEVTRTLTFSNLISSSANQTSVPLQMSCENDCLYELDSRIEESIPSEQNSIPEEESDQTLPTSIQSQVILLCVIS